MNSVRAIFEIDNSILNETIHLGSLAETDSSDEFKVKVRHTSKKSIINCKLFISKYSKEYGGSGTPERDYKKIIWYGDNYPGFGLRINQEYTVFGEVWSHRDGIIIDTTREETSDIFSGNEIEMLSGSSVGEKRTIKSYDIDNGVFYLESDFLTPADGERYRINIVREDFVKSKSGTSPEYAIPLIYKAGEIEKQDEASFTLTLIIPPHAKGAGNHFFDLKLEYTPEEE